MQQHTIINKCVYTLTCHTAIVYITSPQGGASRVPRWICGRVACGPTGRCWRGELCRPSRWVVGGLSSILCRIRRRREARRLSVALNRVLPAFSFDSPFHIVRWTQAKTQWVAKLRSKLTQLGGRDTVLTVRRNVGARTRGFLFRDR